MNKISQQKKCDTFWELHPHVQKSGLGTWPTPQPLYTCGRSFMSCMRDISLPKLSTVIRSPWGALGPHGPLIFTSVPKSYSNPTPPVSCLQSSNVGQKKVRRWSAVGKASAYLRLVSARADQQPKSGKFQYMTRTKTQHKSLSTMHAAFNATYTE